MFTGIVLDIGRVDGLEPRGEDLRLHIRTALMSERRLQPGDSMAVNGVCLTAVECTRDGFAADVSAETLRCTSLGALAKDAPVNLEPALTPETALGGHLVSGHVDALGTVDGIVAEGRSKRFTVSVPAHLSRYIAVKGSVCVDGVSLTVNEIGDDRFTVNIVPHTLEKTLFGQYRTGASVNLEVDVVARYLERLLADREGRG